MIRNRRHYRGFAMVIAIVLIGLCAMTLTALSATLYSQARRTQIAAEDAQIRQLLNAGAAFALQKTQANSPGKFAIQLPDPLAAESAQLSVEFEPASSPNEQVVEVNASLPHHHASQRLVLSLQSGNWQIVEAVPSV